MSKDAIFRVIEILDPTRILINGGSSQGLVEGDILEIFETGEKIKDPQTGEILGTLDFIKDKVEVVTTYEKFSLCKKIIRTKSSIFSPLSEYVTTTSVHIAELKVNKEQITNRKISGNPIISVGDELRIKS